MAEADESRSHLYRVRRVRKDETGLPEGARARWRSHLDHLEREILQEPQVDMERVMEVVEDGEYDLLQGCTDLPPYLSRSLFKEEDSYLSQEPSDTRRKPLVPRLGQTIVTEENTRDLWLLESRSYMDLSIGSSITVPSQIMGSTARAYTTDELSSLLPTDMDVLEDVDTDDEDIDDMFVNPPTPPPEKVKEPWVDRRSPYQKFFAADYKATMWKKGFSDSKPKETLTVQEKEEEQYNMLASDLCNWVAECEFQKVKLDKAMIMGQFRVGMDTPEARAICAQTKILPVVPMQIALNFNLLQDSEMAGVKKQVYWDRRMKKEKGGTRTGGAQEERKKEPKRAEPPRRADGKCICVEEEEEGEKRLPRPADFASPQLLKQQLRSGRLLWSHLEDTKMFKHFCNWLQDNEKYDQPEYLAKKGYFKQKYDINEMEMIRGLRRGIDRKKGTVDKWLEPEDKAQNSLKADRRQGVLSEPGFSDMVTSLVGQLPQLAASLSLLPTPIKMSEDKERVEEWNAMLKPLFADQNIS